MERSCQGIVFQVDGEAVVHGLQEIHRGIEEGCFPCLRKLADAWMDIEARAKEKASEAGGPPHMAPSCDGLGSSVPRQVAAALHGTRRRLQEEMKHA